MEICLGEEAEEFSLPSNCPVCGNDSSYQFTRCTDSLAFYYRIEFSCDHCRGKNYWYIKTA